MLSKYLNNIYYEIYSKLKTYITSYFKIEHNLLRDKNVKRTLLYKLFNKFSPHFFLRKRE